jgi:hypothetical protein
MTIFAGFELGLVDEEVACRRVSEKQPPRAALDQKVDAHLASARAFERAFLAPALLMRDGDRSVERPTDRLLVLVERPRRTPPQDATECRGHDLASEM